MPNLFECQEHSITYLHCSKEKKFSMKSKVALNNLQEYHLTFKIETKSWKHFSHFFHSFYFISYFLQLHNYMNRLDTIKMNWDYFHIYIFILFLKFHFVFFFFLLHCGSTKSKEKVFYPFQYRNSALKVHFAFQSKIKIF